MDPVRSLSQWLGFFGRVTRIIGSSQSSSVPVCNCHPVTVISHDDINMLLESLQELLRLNREAYIQAVENDTPIPRVQTRYCSNHSENEDRFTRHLLDFINYLTAHPERCAQHPQSSPSHGRSSGHSSSGSTVHSSSGSRNLNYVTALSTQVSVCI